MSRNRRQILGRWGEDLAAEFLSQRGIQILGRNVRTPYGELDLVARDANVTIFVEVKTRSSRQFGNPEDAITPAKCRHLLAAASAYLQSHPDLDGDWRIDVIAIRRTRLGPEIAYFENAVN